MSATDTTTLRNGRTQAAIYATSDCPTDSKEVTHRTRLEELNLNWSEKDLPEKERTKHVHRLHPYLGKFIPQLVETFLRKYFSPGQTVLDPFVGSGTTVVQANELGINSIGYDVSAFNSLLCRAKTARYDPNKVQQEVLDILEKVRVETQEDGQENLWRNPRNSKIPKTDNAYLKQWFAPQSLRELLTYRSFIDQGDYRYKDLLKIILSRSARSARLTTHFDLDFPRQPQTESYWCYKHSRECTPTTQAFAFLRRYSLDSLERIRDFAVLRTNSHVSIRHADSRRAHFPPIDGVVTSPPYVGLIDYHEQHAYAYHLLGLKDKRSMEIGPAANGSSQKAKDQYQKDIGEVFSHAAKAMPSGGRMIVVAGDRANLYGEIAKLASVEIETVVRRHVNRRTGRRANEFYESVFIWRKR